MDCSSSTTSTRSPPPLSVWIVFTPEASQRFLWLRWENLELQVTAGSQPTPGSFRAGTGQLVAMTNEGVEMKKLRRPAALAVAAAALLGAGTLGAGAYAV